MMQCHVPIGKEKDFFPHGIPLRGELIAQKFAFLNPDWIALNLGPETTCS